MMPAGDVLRIVELLGAAGVAVWLDGGWGVDALLGEETRSHDDLDLVAALVDADAACAAVGGEGFKVTVDERPTRLVAAAGERRIDLHTVTFDSEGAGWQELQDGRRFRYPPEGFLAWGTVGGRAVRCLSPAVQIACHEGYEPDADDVADVRALCARFGLPLPEAYRER